MRHIITIFGLLTLISCGGSDSSSGESDGGGGSGGSGITFISWNGNANGEVVKDATNDSFRFRADSRQMHFGSTTITNVSVDGGADLIFNGTNIGCVCAVRSTSGNRIAALVDDAGFYIDFFGPESNLTWQSSNIRAVFARPVANKGEGTPMQYVTTAERGEPNAIVENLVEGSATAKAAE